MASRRGNGEGAIYKRADGRWCGALCIGYDAEGKMRRRVLYGKTKKEVQEKIAVLQQHSMQGKSIEPQKITVDEHFQAWLQEKKLRNRESTWKRDESHYRKHIAPQIGRIKLRELTYRHVTALYLDLKDHSGLSPRTIYDVASVLRSGLKDAVAKGLIYTSPAEQITKPDVPHKEARFMNESELRQFLQAAKGERLENLFLLLVNTGLRPGEALGLRWTDVDLVNGTLSVKQALHEVEGKVYIGEVKTESSRRTISLPQSAINALNKQRIKQASERLAAGPKWDNSEGLIFTNTNGGMLRRSNIDDRDLARILKRANLVDVTLHTFRHTHASHLIARGEDIKTVSERLGHKDIVITLKTYSHLMPGRDRKAADTMDEIMAALQD